MKTKNFKNYISILATVNYQNWLDVLPPLIRPLHLKLALGCCSQVFIDPGRSGALLPRHQLNLIIIKIFHNTNQQDV